MSRKITVLLMAIVIATVARAGTVSISTATGHPGEEVTVAVSLSGDDTVTALDLRMALGDNLRYVEGSAALTNGIGGNHLISAAQVGEELRIVVYSLSLSPIPVNGEVATFRLRLGNKPGSFALQPHVVLGDAEGNDIEASAEAGAVENRCPELTVATPEIDFGHVPIRSRYNMPITLHNSGNEPLVINSLTADCTELTVAAAGETIAPGEYRNFTVDFAPMERGAFNGSISIDCNAVNNLVYGRRQKVKVMADPFSVNELHLSQCQGISDSEVTVYARVNNMEPLVGAQFDITLPEALNYVEGSVTTCPRAEGMQIIATQKEQRLSLLLYSMANEAIAGDDGDLMSFRLRLEGNSGWYWMMPENVVLGNVTSENMTSAVEGNYVVIQSPQISCNDRLEMGNHPVTAPISTTLDITNSGQSTLTIKRVAFLAEGYSLDTPLPVEIEPWQIMPLAVTYNPEVTGDFATVMNIYSNDPTQRMKAVEVKGSAYSPNAISLSGFYDNSAYMVDVTMSNHSPIAGVQFDIVCDDTDVLGDTPTVTLTGRAEGLSSSIAKTGEGVYRVLVFSFNNNTIEPGDGDIMRISIPATGVVPDEVAIRAESLILSNADSHNITSPDASSQVTINTTATPGDVNNDGRYNSTDISLIVEYVLGRKPANGIEAAADVNRDGRINSTDVSLLVSYILAGKRPGSGYAAK